MTDDDLIVQRTRAYELLARVEAERDALAAKLARVEAIAGRYADVRAALADPEGEQR
jgi:hypothetical protein